MKARFTRIGVLAVACMMMVLAGGVSSASASLTCTEISGAGSSLQNIAQNNVWIPGNPDMECSTLPTITYTATSSGKGEAQWGENANKELKDEPGVSPFPAFIGTDIGPEGPSANAGTQLNNMDKAGSQGTALGEGVVTVPVAQSAIAVLVSLPLGCTTSTTGSPKVESSALEKEWFKNEGELGSLIKGASVVCANTPKLYARESASGTTAGFKRYLDDINSRWDPLVTTAAKAANIEWPATVEETGFSKGSQLAEGVYNKPGANGAIGYADVADAVKAGFTSKPTLHTAEGMETYSFYVQVQRGVEAGAPVYASPSGLNESSNCGSASYNAPSVIGPNVDWSGAKQTGVTSTPTYPICTLTFDLAWHLYSKPQKSGKALYTQALRNTVYNYLLYIVNEGQNETLELHHYGKLTNPVAEDAKNEVTNALIAF
jgi:ABC-type phosphate transport system substrate-binding protein